MKYTVKVSGKFKKSYKLAQKRGLNVNLLKDITAKLIYLIEDDILTLTLINTGTHEIYLRHKRAAMRFLSHSRLLGCSISADNNANYSCIILYYSILLK